MKALVISGPTASGKTALSVACAKRLNGEIISADALLVYKGLNIGTAKPSKGEMGGIPHYMIDVVAPTESFSASDYERLALPILEDIIARGKVPIIVGGTSFYLDALLYKRTLGGAPADEAVRKKYEAIFEREGKEALFSLLQEIDPASAEVLHPNDKKRVIRALEIYELTGKRKSEQHDERIPRLPVLAVGVDYPREELYARIDARVDEMMRAGLVEEVEGLLESGIPENAHLRGSRVVDDLQQGEAFHLGHGIVVRPGQSQDLVSDHRVALGYLPLDVLESRLRVHAVVQTVRPI